MSEPEFSEESEAWIKEYHGEAERELAELEKKLGLDRKNPRDDDTPGNASTGCPAPVLPPRPVRPAANAKRLPPPDET